MFPVRVVQSTTLAGVRPVAGQGVVPGVLPGVEDLVGYPGHDGPVAGVPASVVGELNLSLRDPDSRVRLEHPKDVQEPDQPRDEEAGHEHGEDPGQRSDQPPRADLEEHLAFAKGFVFFWGVCFFATRFLSPYFVDPSAVCRCLGWGIADASVTMLWPSSRSFRVLVVISGCSTEKKKPKKD